MTKLDPSPLELQPTSVALAEADPVLFQRLEARGKTGVEIAQRLRVAEAKIAEGHKMDGHFISARIRQVSRALIRDGAAQRTEALRAADIFLAADPDL